MMNNALKSNASALIIEQLQARIDSKKIEVPMLPEVAGRVIQTTQDSDSDASDLTNLIQSDQSLAAHVMRIANSAAYSPSCNMVSLQQAITRLGMKGITEIALAASISSSLFNTPGFDKHIQYVLSCSLAAGLWAKECARACRKNVEAAFLSGLLHDIGRPVALQAVLEIASDLGVQLSIDEVHEIENTVQRAIGIQVLEQWEMPSSVQDVMAYFDRYQEPHKGQLQTTIVVAGSLIASHFMCNDAQDYCPSKEDILQHQVFTAINLYQNEIEQLLEREDDVKATMEAMSA
ncbi:MAG: HD-like signal output (HDOD) protein [Flavobacteriales bacterium]|jgi:HD-like signal output (HDOD) protein